MITSFINLQAAQNNAIEVSKEKGEASIVQSKGKYYVEDDAAPFVRSWETLVAVYKNGKKVKT